MNSTTQAQIDTTEIALDAEFLRDLADIEIVLIGGGDILGTGA
jgi:hypothetical protein